MMKFSKRSVTWALLVLLSVAGCATQQQAKDLAEYVNRGVLWIAELEEKALAEYASVTGKNYTTDARFIEVLRDQVIPLYKRFVDALRKITPQSDEVRRLHGIYVFGAETLYEGFKEILIGVENTDHAILRSANAKIEKGRAENERWRKELTAMAEKYRLNFEKKEEKK